MSHRSLSPVEFPHPPDVPVEDTVDSTLRLRFADVAQDGSPKLEPLQAALDVVWQALAPTRANMAALYAQGIFTAIRRYVAEAGPGPIAPFPPLDVRARMQLAHVAAPAGDGAVERIVFNQWAELEGARALLFGPAPADAGARITVGRVFCEYVFSRVFAAPGARAVRRLDVPGLPPVPPAVWRDPSPAELLAVPAGAVALDDDFVADPAPPVWAPVHTDANRHVNSLVYVRLFEDACLRRIARETTRLPHARAVDVVYRKPFFVGERATVLVRVFRLGAAWGAAGVFVGDGGGLDKPHTWVRMRLE